jgi:hypothetical protein
MRFTGVICVLSTAIVVAGCNTPNKRSLDLTLPSGAGAGNGTVSGSLTVYSGGPAVSGATVRLGNSASVSNTAGVFTLTGTPENGSAVVTASTPGFIFRGVAVALSPARSGVQLDLIRDAAPFSFTFYRMLVRNAAEGAQLETIRRWTMNPSFYFQQLTVDTSTRVPDDIIQAMQDNIARSIPELTGGQFSVAAFQKGDGPRDPAEGWVNVTFNRLIAGGFLGFSTVGGNTASITIRYDTTIPSNNSTNPYGCSSIPVAVIDHEITHTMGFWHTDNTLVDTFSGPGCPGNGRPSHTVYHAGIAYARPIGNMDPDLDPVSTAHVIASGGASRPVVACDIASFRRH